MSAPHSWRPCNPLLYLMAHDFLGLWVGAAVQHMYQGFQMPSMVFAQVLGAMCHSQGSTLLQGLGQSVFF